MTAPQKVRDWLTSTGRKQSWLASQVGCADSRLSAWLSGRNVPTAAARKALADLTGLDIASKDAWT